MQLLITFFISLLNLPLIFVISIVAIISLLINRSHNKNKNYWSDRGVKGPEPKPIFGNLFDIASTPLNVLEERRLLKYGRIYGTMIFSEPVLTVAEPELIKQISIKDFHLFTNRKTLFPDDELLSRILLDLKDDDWKRIRSIVSPTFTSGKMKRMFQTVHKKAENTMQFVASLAETKREIALKQLTMSYTMDVIAKVAFGVETNGYKDPNNEFLRKAEELMQFKWYRVVAAAICPSKWQKPLGAQIYPRDLLDYFINTTKYVIKERRAKPAQEVDFVQLLLDAEARDVSEDCVDIVRGHFVNESEEDLRQSKNFLNVKHTSKKLDEIDIFAQAFLFLTAGYETTSTLLAFTLYTLAMKPDIQNRLFQEIDEYFKNHEDINFDDINSLPYLDAVVSEALRLYPPVVNFDRVASEDYKLGNTGITIEKGTVINMPFYAVLHDPELWPEPHEFKPERFFPENRHNIVPYSYIPFGVGPRNCIGMRFGLMSAKIFLVQILRHFRVIKSENTPDKPVFIGKLVTLMAEPLYATFEKR